MADNILEVLRDYRPPTKLHPIAGNAFDLYDAAGSKMTDEVVDGIRKDLEQYQGDLKALTDALCGLTAFMIYVSEKLGDVDGGERVAALIKEQGPKYESLTQRVIEAIDELKLKGKEAFDRFFAREEKEAKRAPVYGEKPPEGSIPASSVKPVAQPPLWAQKKKK